MITSLVASCVVHFIPPFQFAAAAVAPRYSHHHRRRQDEQEIVYCYILVSPLPSPPLPLVMGKLCGIIDTKRRVAETPSDAPAALYGKQMRRFLEWRVGWAAASLGEAGGRGRTTPVTPSRGCDNGLKLFLWLNLERTMDKRRRKMGVMRRRQLKTVITL